MSEHVVALDTMLTPLYLVGALGMPRRSLLVATVLLASRHAAASEPPVEWRWVAPMGCPDGDRVAADVAALVGEGPVRRLEASGEVTRNRDGGWTVRLVIGAGASRRTRELTAPSCEELARAAATLMAIQVSPEETASGAPDKALPAPVVPPVTAIEVERAPRAREADSPRSAFSFATSLLAGASIGISTTTPTLAITVGLTSHRARWEVFGLWSPPRRVEASDGSAGDASLWSVGGRGCWTFGKAVAVGPCLSLESGEISATGAGATVQEPATQRRLWLAASGGGLLVVHGRRLALRLQVDAVAPVFRERFYVEGARLVNRPSPLAGRLLVGVEVHFP